MAPVKLLGGYLSSGARKYLNSSVYTHLSSSPGPFPTPAGVWVGTARRGLQKGQAVQSMRRGALHAVADREQHRLGTRKEMRYFPYRKTMFAVSKHFKREEYATVKASTL